MTECWWSHIFIAVIWFGPHEQSTQYSRKMKPVHKNIDLNKKELPVESPFNFFNGNNYLQSKISHVDIWHLIRYFDKWKYFPVNSVCGKIWNSCLWHHPYIFWILQVSEWLFHVSLKMSNFNPRQGVSIFYPGHFEFMITQYNTLGSWS